MGKSGDFNMSDRAKLPVVDTLGAAFKYPAQHFFHVLKVAFLPMVLFYGAFGLLAVWTFDTFWPDLVEAFDPMAIETTEDSVKVSAGINMVNGLSNLMQLVGLLLTAMITVPLTRAIVSEEKPGFLRLDAAVWWYVLAQVVFGLVILAIFLGCLAIFGGLIAITGSGMDLEGAAALIVLIGFVTFLFIVIRLALFLPEVAVTGKFGFRAAWSMTRGNVWRIIGLSFLLLLAMIIAMIVVCAVLFGLGAALFGSSIADIAASNVDGDPQVILAWVKETLISPAGGFMGAVIVVISLYYRGFTIALGAYMYRALRDNRRDPS